MEVCSVPSPTRNVSAAPGHASTPAVAIPRNAVRMRIILIPPKISGLVTFWRLRRCPNARHLRYCADGGARVPEKDIVPTRRIFYGGVRTDQNQERRRVTHMKVG